MAAFGDDFDLVRFKRAVNTSEDMEAYNRVQAVERALARVQNFVAEPTLTVGTASKVLKSVVQVDGYGAPGSSGSPIFDRNGRVVAVLYGGERESNGKIIYAVPAADILNYLRQQGIRVP